MATILVTGASGFIALHCIDQLLAQNHTVRGTVRSLRRQPEIEAALQKAGRDISALSLYEADLTKSDGWDEAVKGCDYVLHVASPFILGVPKDEDELIKPAVSGADFVVSAAIRHGVKRVVLTSSGALIDAVGRLFGEQALLYKEKVNFKQPGGAGFAPHQDATAYKFADDHITVMLAIDEATTDNGCLEMSAGHHHDLLPTDGDGCIEPAIAASLLWEPVELEAGELLAFSSRTPHRSAPNTSPRQRRALFLTFNRRSAGDHRTAYYADKIRHLAEHEGDGTQRLSTIGHFQGVAPT